MAKELEELLEDLDSGEEVKTKYGICYAYSPEVVEELKQALLELKSIKESNPSEALKCLNFLKEETINDIACFKNSVTTKTLSQLYFANFDTIEQALIKSQEQEKENARYKQLEEQLGCSLEAAVDILLTLKNNMEVEVDSFNGSTKVGKNLYINFNGESLRFKDRETEIKIMNWLEKDRSE